MARRRYVTGLDLGSSKVSAVVAELREDGLPVIAGVGTSTSAGMKRGVVVDIERTVKSIAEAVERAERMSGVPVKSAYINISGAHVGTCNNRGVIAVSREDKEITQEDVDRVMEAARVINIPSDREIVHVLPRQFVVDGYEGVRDPVGMMGVRLEVEAQIVTGAVTSIQNVLRSVYRAGLQVDDVVLAALASGEAVLQPAEKELGVVVVDIGGGTTDLAIFEQGSLWYAGVIPIGGEHITNDLAVGLRTPINQAESVKVRYGKALASLVPDDAYITVTGVGGSSKREASQKTVCTIIEARAQEIAEMIGAEIQKSGYSRIIPGGLVVTGGCSELPGFIDLLSERLDMPARKGTPGGVAGLVDAASSPSLACAVGLVIFASKQLGSKEPGGEVLSEDESFMGRVVNFFRSLF
ncbi:MAG TPA: cell division protein FtsA [Firmicutes bacterium]|nr:cell division protein FtsA [Bacillota bacterium]